MNHMKRNRSIDIIIVCLGIWMNFFSFLTIASPKFKVILMNQYFLQEIWIFKITYLRSSVNQYLIETLFMKQTQKDKLAGSSGTLFASGL